MMTFLEQIDGNLGKFMVISPRKTAGRDLLMDRRTRLEFSFEFNIFMIDILIY